MVGLDDADHPAQGVDHRKSVEIVLVEHFGQFVLVEVGGTGEDARLGQNGEAGIGLRHHQAGQRDRSAQHALFVEHVDFGDTLRVAVEVAQGLDGLRDRGVLADVHEVRGHGAGGGFLVEFEKFLDFLPLLRLHLFEDGVGLLFGEFGKQVGSGARVHLLDDVGDPLLVEFFEQGLLQLGIDFLERLGGDFLIERGKDGFAFGWSKVFEDLGQVGGVHLAEPLVFDAQLDAARRIDFDDVDKLPGNAARGKAAGEGLELRARQQALEDAAQGARACPPRLQPRAAGEPRRGPAIRDPRR